MPDECAWTSPASMIVCQLQGGLGNQLFQYALGRTLAARHEVPLVLDTNVVDASADRAFALGAFDLRARTLSASERTTLRLPSRPLGRIGRVLSRFAARPRIPVLIERSFSFDPSVLAAPPECYLVGYWQSYRYFEHNDAILRDELLRLPPAEGANLAMAARIAGTPAVSLHVRRGDYLNPGTRDFHGLCDQSYYQRAETLLRERVGDIHVYVFSDDPGWAIENLKLVSPMTVVDHNDPGQAHEDLRLMALCRHHIAANSTFSWWGAWLGTNPDRTVIAPRRWFQAPGMSDADLVPPSWLRL